MLPLKQKLMLPRSSLTTTTTASVSSVMPSAARCREPSDLSRSLRVGHREEDAGLGHAQVADDHRPVVQLVEALGQEEGDQQVALHRGVERRALPHHELVEVGVLLEGDEGAHAVARQLGRRGDDLVDDLGLLLAGDPREEGARAHAHQPAADVVLEDDHHDERQRREQRAQQVEERR